MADLSDELAALRASASGFLWIGLKDPTDEEFELVNAELGLHPLAVEDAVMGNQRAKIDAYEGSLLAVLKTCLLYTSPSPRDRTRSRMPSSA